MRASLADRHQGGRTVAAATRSCELDGEWGLDLDSPGDRGGELRAGFPGNRTERQDPDTHIRIISVTRGLPSAGQRRACHPPM